MKKAVVLLFMLCSVGCGGSDGGAPTPAVNFTTVLGTWTLQVQSNASCSGPGPSGALLLQVSQTEADVGFGGGVLSLENATSTWSGGGQSGGYVTGIISLYLPGLATINLVAGAPVNGGPPSPARVATLNGTVTAELGFAGTLSDPSPADGSFEPIFSTSACTYQVTGHHG